VDTCLPFDPESEGGVEATVKIAEADLVSPEETLLPVSGCVAEFTGLPELIDDRLATCHDQLRGPLVRLTGSPPTTSASCIATSQRLTLLFGADGKRYR
jgi:hypothetical protein